MTNTSGTAPIETILDDLRAGRMIVLADDESRENEGDLVCAGQKCTPEIINFMARYGRGMICVPLTAARAGLATGRAALMSRQSV